MVGEDFTGSVLLLCIYSFLLFFYLFIKQWKFIMCQVLSVPILVKKTIYLFVKFSQSSERGRKGTGRNGQGETEGNERERERKKKEREREKERYWQMDRDREMICSGEEKKEQEWSVIESCSRKAWILVKENERSCQRPMLGICMSSAIQRRNN